MLSGKLKAKAAAFGALASKMREVALDRMKHRKKTKAVADDSADEGDADDGIEQDEGGAGGDGYGGEDGDSLSQLKSGGLDDNEDDDTAMPGALKRKPRADVHGRGEVVKVKAHLRRR